MKYKMKKFAGGFLILCGFIFYSCEEILLEDDISNEEVFLTAPANNANLFSTGVSFSWEGPSDVSYHLQVARANFQNPAEITLDTVVAATHFTHQFNIGSYEWRVQAVNSSYETSFTNRFFTVVNNEDFQNNTVTLISPANGVVSSDVTHSLTWQPVIGASEYQVQIFQENTIIHNEIVTENTASVLFPEGSYQWRVRASNGPQQTLYSSRNILVDTYAPNTPVLIAPANLSTVSFDDVSFQWSRQPISGSIEGDSIYVYKNIALTQLLLKDYASQNPYAPEATLFDINSTYYWYVKSFDQAGNSSGQSSVFSFTTD
ncbi:MAG TPA: hypothetical protein VF581_05540 [Flavobacterium sp.]|jgi:hypothetical protein